jgi:hypothetical protein
MMQLGFEGKLDRPFGSHVEVMGNYLVVLLAHESLFRDYQTLCLLDWTRGVVLCVSIPSPTSFTGFCRMALVLTSFFTSFLAPSRWCGYIFSGPNFYIRGYLGVSA